MIKKIIVVVFLFVIAGCTTNREEQSYFADFYRAWDNLKSQNQPISWKQAQKFSYATLSVNFDDSVTALMVLGYLRDNRQKWYSNDRFSITTEYARIVQIYNTDSEISAIQPSPLWQKIRLSSIKLNQSVTLPIFIDYLSLKRIGVKASVVINGDGYETRTLFGKQVRLFRVSEKLSIPSINYEYTNYYWRDPQSGFIWESLQKWGPSVPAIHYRVVKAWQIVKKPF